MIPIVLRAKTELVWHSVTIKGGYYAPKYNIRQIIIFSIFPTGHPSTTAHSPRRCTHTSMYSLFPPAFLMALPSAALKRFKNVADSIHHLGSQTCTHLCDSASSLCDSASSRCDSASSRCASASSAAACAPAMAACHCRGTSG